MSEEKVEQIKGVRARCKNCGTIVHSTHRHHWVACTCYKNEEDSRGFYLDGGNDPYARYGGNINDIEWLK